MDGFFKANSVAVIGVSNSAGNLGRVMVYNLLEFRYHGCIYLVGPRGGSFLGHKIHTSILDIPDPVDLAAVLVPASAVPGVLRQCAEKGVRRIVVESAGFRELGGDRVGLEEEIQQIIAQYGMRMIGPNCIGIIDRPSGLALPFMPFKAEAPPGRVAVMSQSGGVGAMMINYLAAENMGFCKFASIGNKLDVNENDLLDYLIRDDETEAIFFYLEGIARGRRLMELACRSPKPIIVHKSNTGGHGAAIAQSHSASLSTDDRVVDEAFRQCGILRVREQKEAIEVLKGLSLPRMKGNRLAVISRSGGHAVMAADAADEFAFELPDFPRELVRLVEQASRAKVIQFHNPLDLGDLFNFPLYKTLAEKTLAREDIDGLVFIHNYQGIFDAQDSRRMIAGLGELISRLKKPLALCVFTTQAELQYNQKTVDFPIFTDPREAVRALARNRDWHRRSLLPLSSDRPDGMEKDIARSELERVAAGPVPPEVLAGILSAYGVPLVPWEKAASEATAIGAARRLEFPVVLKTANRQVLHKSDVGGVCVDLGDEAALMSAYRGLGRFGDEVLVQKMSEPGLEWLVGGRQDEHFGPVLVVGLGGIYAEVFKETAIRVAPIGYEEADRMLAELRGASLLEGMRGQPPSDRRALLDIMVRIAWILADFPEIQELDLNPVRTFQNGCLALDWRALKRF